MRVEVFMVDVLSVAFMNSSLAFHIPSRFISRRPLLLYFFRPIVVAIFFFVIALVSHSG